MPLPAQLQASSLWLLCTLSTLSVVRTRFQVNDGRVSNLPTYKNTARAILTISRSEGLRGLYAGFSPAVLGSTLSWGLYFFFYGRAKQRYSKNREQKLSPGNHLVSAAEAGALDALTTIMKEEGWSALYKGIVPGLFLVSHGAIQFTVYEELRKVIVDFKSKRRKPNPDSANNLLNSGDYAILGGSSKIAAMLLTYPFQVIRARLQQRPGNDGIPRYMDSWHVVRETARFEGLRGFYKGITPNLLKNVPAASLTFIVYENVLNFLKKAGNTY